LASELHFSLTLFHFTLLFVFREILPSYSPLQKEYNLLFATESISTIKNRRIGSNTALLVKVNVELELSVPGIQKTTMSQKLAGDNKANAKNEKTTTVDNNELWFQEDERWELTWPIWHMLPRGERKELAHKHGYKTIGEFEEYMTLQRAVGDSSDLPSVTVQEPYENKSLYVETIKVVPDTVVDMEKQRKQQVEENEDDYKSDNDEKLQDQLESEQRAAAEDMTEEQLIEIAGKILVLPDEMLHKIFEWLPVDTYGVLALVSPHWRSFTRTEAVYRRLCERLYLNQSKRQQLHVSRFGNSYRSMLEKRPRVRAGGGVYVMKYARVKKIQRDMWTEVRQVALLFHDVYNVCRRLTSTTITIDSRWSRTRNSLLSLSVLSRGRPCLVCSHPFATTRNVPALSQGLLDPRSRQDRCLGQL